MIIHNELPAFYFEYVTSTDFLGVHFTRIPNLIRKSAEGQRLSRSHLDIGHCSSPHTFAKLRLANFLDKSASDNSLSRIREVEGSRLPSCTATFSGSSNFLSPSLISYLLEDATGFAALRRVGSAVVSALSVGQTRAETERAPDTIFWSCRHRSFQTGWRWIL